MPHTVCAFVLAALSSASGCSSAANSDEFQVIDTDGEETTAGTTSGGSDTTGTESGETEGGDPTEGDPTDDGETDSSGEETGTTGPDEPVVPDPSMAEEFDGACGDESIVAALRVPDTNGMTSPAHARGVVTSKSAPLMAVDIRPWEFLNYYSFDYPAAEPGNLAIVPELVVDPEDSSNYILQVSVSSELRSNAERASANLALVLDTSGSMEGPPLLMMQESMRALASNLRLGDTVSLVTWSADEPLLARHSVIGANDPVVLEAIASLDTNGGSDLDAGLGRGYALVTDDYNVDALNRVVLVSDGSSKLEDATAELIGEYADEIQLIGVGVGESGSFSDGLVHAAGAVGRGASVFVGDSHEAWKIFGENFVQTIDVAARGLHINVELPPGLALAGVFDDSQSTEDFSAGTQDLAPNDTLIVRQSLELCGEGDLDGDEKLTVWIDYLDPVTDAPVTAETTVAVADLLAGASHQADKATAVVGYARALELWSDPWQTTSEQRAAARQDALSAVTLALEVLPGDAELVEISAVLQALAG
ncbi:MAG: vWA domain-containing protein [Nannocystaceae bacterium]